MPLAQKKRWSELTPRERTFVVAAAAIEIVLTTIAMRDLRDRPKALVRGPKWVWRLVSFVQPVGPVAYLVLGRRSTSD